jgi:small conductance mechanosensitive channel
MDLSAVAQTTVTLITVFALKVLGAILVWLIARRVVAYVAGLVVRSLKYPFDQTVAGYIGTAVAVLLNIGLILGILGLFGIETTSFAALLAGVGIAIGAAWGGLLANLAPGFSCSSSVPSRSATSSRRAASSAPCRRSVCS